VAHVLGAMSPEGHLDSSYLDPRESSTTTGVRGAVLTAHDAWMERYLHLRDEAKDEEYVKHHILRYEGRIPIWAAVQFMAELFGLKNDETGRLAKLLRPLNVLRNNCVHNNRVWNRNTIYPPPRIPGTMIEADLQHFNALTDHERQRLYALVVLLAYFIRHLHPERVDRALS
jgi:abortive infection bacteriophage resistance protein